MLADASAEFSDLNVFGVNRVGVECGAIFEEGHETGIAQSAARNSMSKPTDKL